MRNRIVILFLIASLVISLSACQAAGPAAGDLAGITEPTGTKPTEAQLLTAEEAQSIALADAGFTADQVTGLRTEYDVDDGVKEYEVDFRVGDWEYDYGIHAETGAILTRDQDLDPITQNPEPTEPPPTEPAPTEPAPVAPTEPAPTEPPADRLTAVEAEDIALNHAGLNRDAVSFQRTEYDLDDGVPVYEIEFYADGWEYDYEIHAQTGKIRSSDKEYDPPKDTPVVSPTESAPVEPPADRLTAAEAEDIALNHAGLNRDAVSFQRTEYDLDDGVPVYEIEFYADGWEYDYEIHAQTGKIRSSDKEYDPPTRNTPVVAPTESAPVEPPADRLTAAEAEDIALNHAGLNRDTVRFQRTEYDLDDGVPVYEIEFYADGWEYEYEIHAQTGKIRSSDKEYND